MNGPNLAQAMGFPLAPIAKNMMLMSIKVAKSNATLTRRKCVLTKKSQALLRGVKIVALSIAVLILGVTIYGYDGQPNSDIWIFLTWTMLALSFPAGLIVSLAHMTLGTFFSITIETSYVSLTLEWLVYFLLAYLQWCKAVPYLVNRLRSAQNNFPLT